MPERAVLKNLVNLTKESYSFLKEDVEYYNVQSSEYLKDLFSDYKLPFPKQDQTLFFDFDMYYKSLCSTYKFSRVPYFNKLLTKIENDTSDVIVIKKAAQIGATTFFIGLMLYYFVKYKLPVLYISKRVLDVQKVRAVVVDILRGLGIYCPATGADYILTEVGTFYFAAANTPDSFRGKPAAFIFLDEIATYPTNVGGEGDIISLALSRKSTFSSVGKIFAFSTPTTEDTVLEELYNSADKKYFYSIFCKNCNYYFSPALTNLIATEEKYTCPKCFSELDKFEAIANGDFFQAKNEQNLSDQKMQKTFTSSSFKINQYVSTLTKNSQIHKFFQNASNSRVAKRAFQNLVEAESVETKITAPSPALIDNFEGTHSIYSIDIHYKDFSYIKLELNHESNIFCITEMGQLGITELIPFCENSNINICIDIGLLSNNDIAKNSSFLRYLLLCRGATTEKQKFIEFKRDGIKSTYYVYRQHTINYLLQLIENGKFYILNNLPEHLLKDYLLCFKYLYQKKTNSGAIKWVIPEEHHEITHHFDATLYGLALICHNKDMGRLDSFVIGAREKIIDRGQKSTNKKTRSVFGVL